MTAYNDDDRYRVEDDGHGNGDWTPDCSACYHWNVNHCDGMDSDHYGHLLMPFHPACEKFEERY